MNFLYFMSDFNVKQSQISKAILKIEVLIQTKLILLLLWRFILERQKFSKHFPWFTLLDYEVCFLLHCLQLWIEQNLAVDIVKLSLNNWWEEIRLHASWRGIHIPWITFDITLLQNTTKAKNQIKIRVADSVFIQKVHEIPSTKHFKHYDSFYTFLHSRRISYSPLHISQ